MYRRIDDRLITREVVYQFDLWRAFMKQTRESRGYRVQPPSDQRNVVSSLCVEEIQGSQDVENASSEITLTKHVAGHRIHVIGAVGVEELSVAAAFRG